MRGGDSRLTSIAADLGFLEGELLRFEAMQKAIESSAKGTRPVDATTAVAQESQREPEKEWMEKDGERWRKSTSSRGSQLQQQEKESEERWKTQDHVIPSPQPQSSPEEWLQWSFPQPPSQQSSMLACASDSTVVTGQDCFSLMRGRGKKVMTTAKRKLASGRQGDPRAVTTHMANEEYENSTAEGEEQEHQKSYKVPENMEYLKRRRLTYLRPSPSPAHLHRGLVPPLQRARRGKQHSIQTKLFWSQPLED